MGSKRAMLQNGLGELLAREVKANGENRFVDLFAGSGAVAIHIAQKVPIHVLAFDLQAYSAVIAGAIIERKKNFAWEDVWADWEKKASRRFAKVRLPKEKTLTRSLVDDYL